MKNLFLVAICFGLMAPMVSAQSNCSKYYPMVEGVSMTYTSFNKKGKEDSTVEYKVIDVQESSGETKATMSMELKAKKGGVFTSNYDLTCRGDKVIIDFESLMNQQMMGQFGGTEVDITGHDIELPNKLSVGQELADAYVNVSGSLGGAFNVNMKVEQVNRKVEKKENVTTPAGSFDCYVVYSDTKTKMMVGTQTFSSRMWLAEDVGIVKQESYNQNGKLMGSMQLTGLSK
ncbi:DUF3108 domain-containing protein [Flagellimonas algicola]|uniref:DUF3108 domain-containing protein n=1 Tax=Flagellimonas algicola TaxID=2583815 RepID=A0ABY2WMC2_9FLAO|nr:DUF3108 domain-containing protein [Allomuricauda algicola]TMU55745.1 DUF3108 domain-containing protein [Allomuricauda algicola]